MGVYVFGIVVVRIRWRYVVQYIIVVALWCLLNLSWCLWMVDHVMAGMVCVLFGAGQELGPSHVKMVFDF